MPGLFQRNARTFKPKKHVQQSTTKREALAKFAQATLGSGNLREAVTLPEGEDCNEWLAVNTVDFFNQINMLYSTISEFCTPETCPTMTAGPKFEYLWADGAAYKTPTRLPAPQYVECLMGWVQTQLDNESIFPSKIGVPFPKNFIQIVKTIFKRLFRVYAHIYHSHFEQIVDLGEEAHLNTITKHFIYFVQEFDLVNEKELVPLQDLIDRWQ
ncbi:Mob1/phocein [Carpediemonas membranifera]|uniref:Mob1/phocein n=1 Tax=Carpediemonas membranifera TaxID=201153 RepID=A0A8J6B295_9EUKA|nr:Mob1/phocein [Carpediemonas membranifera]|eukprot:KAG9391442.1 Mob1/phocein [Carpediemonas membranifera]